MYSQLTEVKMIISNFLTQYWSQIIIILIVAIPSIIFFTVKQIISNLFKKDLETHRAVLEEKSKQIQSSFDTQLEILRIQFSSLNTERLDILKEACIRITETLNQINKISSFHNYKCKESIDYDSKCLSSGSECDESCILNYWDKIVAFDKYTRQTHDFFEYNQMFFPLEIVSKHLKIITLVFSLRKKAFDIYFQENLNSKQKALKCFELFNNFEINEINSLQNDLLNEYRIFIGVSPLKNFTVEEYKLCQKQYDKIKQKT